VLSLARYDLNFDVRDRARMLGSLLNGVTTLLRGKDEESEQEVQGGVILRREQVKLVLFEGKSAVSEEPLHSGESVLWHSCLC
jgi:AP-3 complex subunit beta